MSLDDLPATDDAIIHLKFKYYIVGGEDPESVRTELRMKWDHRALVHFRKLQWVEELAMKTWASVPRNYIHYTVQLCSESVSNVGEEKAVGVMPPCSEAIGPTFMWQIHTYKILIYIQQLASYSIVLLKAFMLLNSPMESNWVATLNIEVFQAALVHSPVGNKHIL